MLSVEKCHPLRRLAPFLLLLARDMFVPTPEHIAGWGYALATVLSFYVLSNALWFFSLKQVPAWLASALRCVGPVFAAPLAWILFDSRMNFVQISGAQYIRDIC